MGCYHIPGLALFPPCLDLNVRFWPIQEAQQAHPSGSFGENRPLDSIDQRRFTTQVRHSQDILENLAVLHDDPKILAGIGHQLDVLQRITVDQQQVRIGTSRSVRIIRHCPRLPA
jgi:hypothetical protein